MSRHGKFPQWDLIWSRIREQSRKPAGAIAVTALLMFLLIGAFQNCSPMGRPLSDGGTSASRRREATTTSSSNTTSTTQVGGSSSSTTSTTTSTSTSSSTTTTLTGPSGTELGAALDLRRCDQLQITEGEWTAVENAGDSTKGWKRLRYANDYNYFSDALAIFSRVQNCGETVARKEEANRLLRYITFCSNHPDDQGRPFYDADCPCRTVNHCRTFDNTRTTTQAIRLYLWYRDWLDSDLRTEFRNRLTGGLNVSLSTENHNFDHRAQIILAKEIAGNLDAAYQEQVQIYIDLIKSAFQYGMWEFGSNYQDFTRQGLFALYDLSTHQELKRWVGAFLDYIIAEQAEYSLGTYFAGARVRIYEWGLSGRMVSPLTGLAEVNFGQAFGQIGGTSTVGGMPLEYVITDYMPMVVHDEMFKRRDSGEITSHQGSIYTVGFGPRIWRKFHYHYLYRANAYAMGVSQRTGRIISSNHGFANVYIQSQTNRLSRVVPWALTVEGHQIAGYSQRALGYKNVAIIQEGGEVESTIQPTRLFYSNSFQTVEIEGSRAFLSDGEVYVAWLTTQGQIRHWAGEPSHANGGNFLESSFTPAGSFGEISVIEAGDAASYGSYEGFKQSVRARMGGTGRPSFGGGVTRWNAPDGTELKNQGNDKMFLGGVQQNYVITWEEQHDEPSPYTRMNGLFLKGQRLQINGKTVDFNITNGQVSGATDRFIVQKRWGLGR